MTTPARSLFDVPEDVAYFNAANIGPRLRAVSEAGRDAIDQYARPWEIDAEDWFSGPEELRAAFADLVGVATDRVALVPSVSYGIALAAKNLRVDPGSSIVVVDEQYPSNVYAWRRKASESSAHIVAARRDSSASLTDSVLRSIDRRTAVVAIPNCHWTDGEVLDLASISRAARSVGARLVVDASQSLGVRPIDLSDVRPDFMVSVGYKWLLGPYGLGYLYADEEWCANGVPLEESWLTRKGSEDFSRLVEYVDDYRSGARRFDFGEFPQFISVPMAIAAITQFNRWGVEHVASRVAGHIATIRSTCEEVGSQVLPLQRSSLHMIGVRIPDSERCSRLATRLKAEKVIVSRRGETIRIAPHMHTTEADVEKLCGLIQSADG